MSLELTGRGSLEKKWYRCENPRFPSVSPWGMILEGGCGECDACKKNVAQCDSDREAERRALRGWKFFS